MAGQTIARADNTFSLRPNCLGSCYNGKKAPAWVELVNQLKQQVEVDF